MEELPKEGKDHTLLPETSSPPPLILPGWIKPDPDWGVHYESPTLPEEPEDYVCGISETLRKAQLCPEHDPECYCGQAGSNYSFVLFKKPKPPPAPKQSVLYTSIKVGRGPKFVESTPESSSIPIVVEPTPSPVIMKSSPTREIVPSVNAPAIPPPSPGREIALPGPSQASSLNNAVMETNFAHNLAEFSKMGLDEMSQVCNLVELFDSITLFFGQPRPLPPSPQVIIVPAVMPRPIPKATMIVPTVMPSPMPKSTRVVFPSAELPKKRAHVPKPNPSKIALGKGHITTTVGTMRQYMSNINGPGALERLKLMRDEPEPVAKRIKKENVP